MSYQSYNTVHKMPGVVLDGPVPTTEDDMTTVEPIAGEVRVDETNIYVATTVVPGTSVVWTKTAQAAWV